MNQREATTRRAALSHVKARASTHPGLWLDTGLLNDGDGQKAQTIVEAVQGKRPPPEYERRFEEIRDSFRALGERCRLFEAKVQGRLVLGLGNKNVLEIGIRLDHSWGVPILPGSALKGLASRTAHLNSEPGSGWSRPSDPSKTDGGEHHQNLFGSVEGMAELIFHDAWWFPNSKQDPLAIDVMTVHHPDYYQGNQPATDMDSPNPVSFVTAQGTFLVALELAPGADPSWLDVGSDILAFGLKHHGLGAKTNAGYGRMTLTPYLTEAEKEAAKEQKAAQGAVERYLARAELVDRNTVQGFVDELWTSSLDEAGKAQVAQQVRQKIGNKWLKKKADKQYVKNLFAMCGDN